MSKKESNDLLPNDNDMTQNTYRFITLDRNELAASLNGISLALMEFGNRLMEMHTHHKKEIIDV